MAVSKFEKKVKKKRLNTIENLNVETVNRQRLNLFLIIIILCSIYLLCQKN